VVNKKGSVTFKRLEQALKARDENGREVSINKNCAAMDLQVPMLMGVSAAVLENVIFCHQDEALWPFSDQANLKKIFDDIFDTSSYSKVLGELRAMQKERTKEAKALKQEFDLLLKDHTVYT
jgi:DNA repair protein RAD50